MGWNMFVEVTEKESLTVQLEYLHDTAPAPIHAALIVFQCREIGGKTLPHLGQKSVLSLKTNDYVG